LEKCLIPGLGQGKYKMFLELGLPALWRLRQEDRKFKVNWGYIARPCLKKKQQESLLPFPAWEVRNVSLFFSPIPPHFYPLILNVFANKLYYYFYHKKRNNKKLTKCSCNILFWVKVRKHSTQRMRRMC
jgi:hypothetical protein